MALNTAKSKPYTAPGAMLASGVLQSQGITGGKLRKISVPEMIAQSNVRPQGPVVIHGLVPPAIKRNSFYTLIYKL